MVIFTPMLGVKLTRARGKVTRAWQVTRKWLAQIWPHCFVAKTWSLQSHWISSPHLLHKSADNAKTTKMVSFTPIYPIQLNKIFFLLTAQSINRIYPCLNITSQVETPNWPSVKLYIIKVTVFCKPVIDKLEH